MALMVVGCGKHASKPAGEKDTGLQRESVESPLPPEQVVQIESQFLPSPNTKKTSHSPAIEDRLDGAVHAQLTAQLRMFKAFKGRMPENFYELANSVGDSVPRLPDGMKFVIDPADQTVKAMRK